MSQQFSPELFQMGYIIQYRWNPNNFIHKRIQRAQLRAGFSPEESSFVHVEVSGGGFDSTYINPPKTKGVDIRLAHGGRYIRVMKYCEYDGDYQDRKRLKVAYFSGQLCNLKYDVKGLFNFYFPFLSNNKRKYFCSEGCLWALQKPFPNAVHGLDPYRCMPAHFGKSQDLFEIVWEGYIPKPTKRQKKIIELSLIKRTPMGQRLKSGAQFSLKF